MIALIRKNLRLWGYGKSLALFAGCILFSISGRLNGGIAYERHILSAVSDHYYLTYFVLPIVLLSCFSFIDDDGEPVILRFQSYHSYFLKKWIGVGLIAVILTAVQTGAILLSGIGLPLGNEWNLAAGATEAELFSTLEQLFASPLQAFVCFTLYQLIGSWLIFGICMWIGHFTGRKWTIRIVIVLYVLSAVWIKLPAIQNIPLTSFNHLLILHHNLGVPHRLEITAFTLLLIVLIIAIFTGVVLSSRGQAISSEISGNSEGGAALSLANTEDTEIIINELASEIPETGFFALGPDNYHEYTKEELFDYYGIEFDISSVFPDMIEENTGSYGIFKFSDGSDMQGHNFIWANPIGNEKVSIEIIKDGAPKSDNTQVTNDSAPLASTISGENVNIFRFDSDEQSGYYAEFVHKSLGFTVYGYNFDKDDFVRILSYLISC